MLFHSQRHHWINPRRTVSRHEAGAHRDEHEHHAGGDHRRCVARRQLKQQPRELAGCESAGNPCRGNTECEAGDHDRMTKPLNNSYHDIWMEMHEDLIATLGLKRTEADA